MVAAGKAELIKGEWLKKGAVVIDVGINAQRDLTKKSGVRLVGDVEFSKAQHVAGHITAVPGGVGPMTVAMLMENTLLSARRFWQAQHETGAGALPKITPLHLELKTPVPSDIDIALGQQPKNIKQMAEEIGLGADEVCFTQGSFTSCLCISHHFFQAHIQFYLKFQTMISSSCMESTRQR